MKHPKASDVFHLGLPLPLGELRVAFAIYPGSLRRGWFPDIDEPAD